MESLLPSTHPSFIALCSKYIEKSLVRRIKKSGKTNGTYLLDQSGSGNWMAFPICLLGRLVSHLSLWSTFSSSSQLRFHRRQISGLSQAHTQLYPLAQNLQFRSKNGTSHDMQRHTVGQSTKWKVDKIPYAAFWANFVAQILSTFSLSCWEANSYYPRAGKAENGKGELSQPEWIGCLGHSSWTICSFLSQFCWPNFSTFSLSCWEANSYYPRGLILRKGNSPNFRNGWEREGSGCPRHSN